MFGKKILEIYGISQNPDTNDYILVQKNFTWLSGNEKIDNFIQEMQLNINSHNDIVLEWIPYNYFNEIKKINSITIYSAIWKDGPLYWNEQSKKYTRDSNKEVALNCLSSSKNLIEFVLN